MSWICIRCLEESKEQYFKWWLDGDESRGRKQKKITLSKQIQVNKPYRRFREGKQKHASMLVLFFYFEKRMVFRMMRMDFCATMGVFMNPFFSFILLLLL